jgi:resuscitation-promoting factor RpfB
MRTKLRLFKKQYAIKHRQHKKLVHRVRKHPAFFVPAMTGAVLFCVAVVAFLVYNRQNAHTYVLSSSNSRVVILRVDGDERIVPTRVNTVGELLQKLEVVVHEGDVVEPALNTEIVNDNFRVNVYRALPITIIDGDRETQALSAAATPRSIAKQSGIEAYPEDIVALDPTQDFVTQGVIGQKLVVDRATPVNVNLYGSQIAARTQANTVAEFLKEKNIKLGPGETVQPAADAPVSANEPIFVNRKGIQVQVVNEDIAMETQFVEDASLTFGVTAVRQQGVPGKRVVTYQVNIETGAKTKFQEIVIQQPVAQIVARGNYVNIPSDKQGVMAAAGIAKSDYTYVDYIVSRESRWNAGAYNARSGATGLCQAVPGGKMASAGADWKTNPVTQMKWCNGYAKGRYGSWQNAYNTWVTKHWW